jgi:hypothetical protein
MIIIASFLTDLSLLCVTFLNRFQSLLLTNFLMLWIDRQYTDIHIFSEAKIEEDGEIEEDEDDASCASVASDPTPSSKQSDRRDFHRRRSSLSFRRKHGDPKCDKNRQREDSNETEKLDELRLWHSKSPKHRRRTLSRRSSKLFEAIRETRQNYRDYKHWKQEGLI